MQGIIFVTWEKYLNDQFGSAFLQLYRETIGESVANVPLTSRVYDDALLLAGVGAASNLAGVPVESLLRAYGRYFLVNGLTSHLCAYLLSQVHSGRDLVLTMRQAHARMRHTPDGLTPPVFRCEILAHAPNGLTLVYDSHRQLCPVLYGAIEGAAERFGERANIFEHACMKQGASACLFEVHFVHNSILPFCPETPQQVTNIQARQRFANLVLSALPDAGGMTLYDLQRTMQHWPVSAHQLRPSVLLEALHHLQFAGHIASTANQPGDTLTLRRYWRIPTPARADTQRQYGAGVDLLQRR
ncbi:MAG TPA: heme NO-binding domain-containing protein [Ktedonobacteraceae bacterium]|nr:heme NO-binding domain-containing protein [Ktedonobacteraceae bacterium]